MSKVYILSKQVGLRSALKFLLLLALLLGQVTVTQVQANGLQQKVSINYKSTSAENIIKELNKQTSVSFTYDRTTLRDIEIPIIKFEEAPLEEVLNYLQTSADLEFTVLSNTVVVRKKKLAPAKVQPKALQQTSAQQERSVTGTVKDEKGQALPGVTVVLKGTNRGTSTDVSGRFNLSVPEGNSTLVFSFIGYKPQEIDASSQHVLDVSLEVAETSLNEVVVTALNVERNQKSLGYAVATVDGKNVSTVQTPNIVNSLSGKVAGVDVGNISNGVAGSKRIVIRGASSLTGDNQPLWVVDGIPITSSNLGSGSAYGGIDYGDGLTGINSEDIESISVLKGNAAAALYGSRASNGVILVTTKSGKSATSKMDVDISSSFMFDKVLDFSDFQKEYGQSSLVKINQKPANQADAFGAGSWGARLDGQPTVQFDGVERPYSAVEDNYTRFFRTGNTITNTVALSGKSEHNNYRISFSDLRNRDVMPNAKFSRTGLNLKNSAQYGKFKADIVANYVYEKADNRPFIGGNVANVFYSLYSLPANIDIETLSPGYKPDGTEFTYADFVNNPYFIVNREKEADSKNRLSGSASLQYDFSDLLYARGRFTRDYYAFNRLSITPEGVLYRGYLGGSLDQQTREMVENNYEFMFGTNQVGGEKFKVSGFVGGNINWRSSKLINASGNTFVVPGVYTFNNLENKFPSTRESSQRTNSLFGSLDFAFQDYLFLSVTARNDWFSTLPIENNNLLYPSAALSFVFSDAFQMPSFVSFGKLRASTAQVSGDTGPGQLDLSYSLESVKYNSNSLQVIGTSNIPNKNLKPLLSSDYETGIELDLFDHRLGFDVAYYKRVTTDDIVRTAVSPSTGYSSALLNVGEMENQGIEVLMRATPVFQDNLEWNLTATYSNNMNKVRSLGSGTKGAPILLAESKTKEAFIQVVEGEPYGQIYGFGYERTADGQKIFDAQGYPVRTSEPILLGNGVYKHMAGLSNTFTWKNITFGVLLDAKFGADIYSESNVIATGNGTHKMTLNGRETGIVGEGVVAAGEPNLVSVPAEKLNAYYGRIASIAEEFIYDASFVKLRELSFNYSFPNQLVNRIGIKNASVTLMARNLLTLYKNTENVDPESSIVSGNAQGIERFGYPSTLNYGATLRLGF
jgi:TonB-linked SusC/RagA family outer membrane protein